MCACVRACFLITELLTIANNNNNNNNNLLSSFFDDWLFSFVTYLRRRGVFPCVCKLIQKIVDTFRSLKVDEERTFVTKNTNKLKQM